MKKILSVILALTMVFTLFAGLSVSAEDTATDLSSVVMTAQRKRSAYAETSNILGTAVSSGIANSGGTDLPKAGFVYDVPAEPDTHNLSMRLSSSKVTGIGVTGVREYFTFTPYAHIAGGVDAFMVYLELPEYNKYGEQWSMRSLSFQMYDEGITAQWKTPCNMTIKYLENDAAAWVTTTVGANGEYYLPSGFKGYIKMYFNTATNGNSTENLYDFLNSKGITTADGFIIGCMQFELNYIGGAYGDVVVGGMYNVISDGDALTANLSDDGGTAHVKTAKLTGTDRHVGDGVTTFWNQRGNYDVAVGDAITYNVLSSNTLGDATLTWTNPAIGSKHPAMKISSETATGNAYGVTGRWSSIMWTPIDPEIGAFGMYLELPTYADGDQWVIMNKSFAFSDGTNKKYITPANMKISYLAIDGKEWVDSITSSSGHFYLPSGFKGYVKCYLKTATNGNSTQNLYDAFTANGIDYETKLQINAFQFDVKRVGGEYGDLIIGGPYGLKADGNSLEANITDWKYSSNVSKITTYEPTLTAVRKNYAYFDDTTCYEGAAVSASVAKIWDLGWYTDNGNSQATISWTAPVEPDTNNAAIRAQSPIAEGQGMEIGPSNLLIHPNTEIDPEINALMLYVELPLQGTPLVDGPGQWGDYTIKTNAGTFYQDGFSEAKYGRMYKMTISYLERDGKEWKVAENSGNNENFVLPNGFKGYIKLHLDTAITDTSTGKTLYEHLESQGLDTTKNFRVADINIVFGWLGGKFGDFVVGGMYEITEDGNGIYANLSDSDGSNAKYACLTTYKSDNENRIALIEDVVANNAEPTIEDGEAIHDAVDAYNNIAEEYIGDVSGDTLNALYAIEDAYDVYRPSFIGSTVKDAAFDDDQALRIDMTIDTTAAAAAGYTVSEYGIVVLKDQLWSNSVRFGTDAENATVYRQTGIGDDTVINYSFLIETNDADVMQLDHYVRSYVVYTNGTDNVTVWNARYERDAYTSIAGGSDDATVAATNEFYYRTSIIETSSYLDISVMAGAGYGDADMNGFVETDDLVSLRKHLLAVSKNPYDFIVDVNDDGKVNVKDLVRFKKYFADTENVKIGADTYTTYSYIDTPVSEAVEYAVMSLSETAADTAATTDLTVTAFNVGHFYLGTQDGINNAYGEENAQKALDGWEAFFAKAAAKSDIYAFQEFGQKYYWDDTTTITPDEVMLGEGKPFKQIEKFFGYSQGEMEMGMALGATSDSEYSIHNISYGYVGGKNTYYRRAYIKGYITVKGVEVAVISIHPGGYGSAKGNSWDNGSFMWKDCFDELVALMNQEEYCIVLGDTNSNSCGAYMQSKGMNIANCGAFGNFNTNMYGTDKYIDNVFTTPNIDIVSVEVIAEDRGGSDHYPITAGLFVNTEMGSTKGNVVTAVDTLGFATGRY